MFIKKPSVKKANVNDCRADRTDGDRGVGEYTTNYPRGRGLSGILISLSGRFYAKPEARQKHLPVHNCTKGLRSS